MSREDEVVQAVPEARPRGTGEGRSRDPVIVRSLLLLLAASLVVALAVWSGLPEVGRAPAPADAPPALHGEGPHGP